MVPNPRLRILSEEYPVLVTAGTILARSYFYSLLSRLVQGVSSEEGWVWQRLPDPQWASAKTIALDKYTEDLETVIEQAGKSGVTILLVTVVSNISEYPIQKANWDQLPNLKFPESMDAWRSHYEMGIQLYREGKFEESLREFSAARENSLGGRAPSSLNETVRRMAETYPHVHLVDFETILQKLGVQEGLIGCNFFGTPDSCDQFHPNPRTHELIAQQVAESIAQLRAQGDETPE